MAVKSKSTRVDRAYDRLKEDILSSGLPPGFQAPEPDIAERLGMSRTPVREALIRLEADGLVELVPRRGAKVLALSLEDLSEIYDLLIALEPCALAKLTSEKIDAEALEELEALIGEMEGAQRARDLDAWVDADDRFHRKLLSLSGNQRLTHFTGSLLDQVHRGRMVLLRMLKAPIGNVQQHRDVLAAILTGDGAAAADLARRHRIAAKQALEDVFSSCRLSQV
ncbi:GntR family transcriptional regulator [Roseibium polysiphoniae]|uniref:GntR family transcriptional regulator n=1 Tax=Roseibium polysiphoniae TaxID=2571221 RepID=A0A944CDA7_9HYPH|nr:GntR family transcriptional regulator [Roseibium polysiphoniae]MBS8260863.1 GntR family transcriptional regulator [Roseibium polysiphoniae]